MCGQRVSKDKTSSKGAKGEEILIFSHHGFLRPYTLSHLSLLTTQISIAPFLFPFLKNVWGRRDFVLVPEADGVNQALTRTPPFFSFPRLLFSQYRLADIKTHCLEEFRRHWACLDNNNHQLWQCRRHERPFNACVYDKLVRLALRTESPPSPFLLLPHMLFLV
jgi:hypothetical protein